MAMVVNAGATTLSGFFASVAGFVIATALRSPVAIVAAMLTAGESWAAAGFVTGNETFSSVPAATVSADSIFNEASAKSPFAVSIDATIFLPAAQPTVQVLCPTALLDLPSGQSVQTLLPAAPEYFPVAQSVQAVEEVDPPAATNLPAPHAAHRCHGSVPKQPDSGGSAQEHRLASTALGSARTLYAAESEGR